MGLGFLTKGIPFHEDFGYHDRANWSYTGFGNFRRRLALETLGVTLEEVWDYPDRFRSSPLFPLLHHSDCEGILTAKECSIIGPSLIAATQNWSHNDYDRIQAHNLARHMDYCASTGRDLEFM